MNALGENYEQWQKDNQEGKTNALFLIHSY